MLGYQRVIVAETKRVLVLQKGRFVDILGPGEHRLKARNLDMHSFALSDLRFDSHLEQPLRNTRPDLVERHFFEVVTGPDEVAVVARSGRAHAVVSQDKQMLFWKDAADWSVEMVPLGERHEVPAELAQRLMRSGLTKQMVATEVAEGKVGLLTVDGVFDRVLQPGTYWFWMLGRKHLVKQVDLRWQMHEVNGQEMLTRDRVTLRVNITADYRVVDPVKAVQLVKDFAETLHRALQLAFRKTLGALTLDALLADKVSVDAEAAEAVRVEMAGIGIELGEIALKDVILPGEMREILNQVVTAQKEAEANVIRRREETNATRSLLNTAKVMAEHPVMMRLKELEALEAVADKVDNLTVLSGTEGLMNDLVKMR
ncbi:hypothetical protein ACMU_09140 [Actibacterium mucosum KCTC 23349]|uniref:Band 7 domain-containing protein n=2 Tax=Actibacterium TaxID=1433986 RepID=A0A037ZK70_9RHOB|nr:hypothetical protein ACMU_09140 [Actibacterium mucosum KCTC 23349]